MKKGFTLIELLAVIVILAIIALIATPLIMDVIEDVKKSSTESSGKGYVDAVEKQIATNLLDTDSTNDISNDTYTISDLKDKNISVKGEIPSDESWVQIEKGQVTDCSLKFSEYTINCNKETVKGGEVLEYGPTKESATATATHKGIVYFDPTYPTRTCDSTNSVSTTETKTGCMKWYIYAETDTEYKMILDHNTTARIKWNDLNSNVAYESSNLYQVVQELKTVSGWVVDTRIISAEEINTITGKTGFDASNSNSWYYLDSKTTTGNLTSKGTSNYLWLYDNSYKCENYGCNINDNNSYIGLKNAGNGYTYGYWTSTIYGDAGQGSIVWCINRVGALYDDYISNNNYGVRPVITISKNLIS